MQTVYWLRLRLRNRFISRLASIAPRTIVVPWTSEYRVYVVESEIRSIDWYAGDRDVQIDRRVVERAIAALDAAGAAPAGYALDFGVLAAGATALVEMNDGFALGAYQIAARDYTDLLWARWEQLLGSLNSPPNPIES